MENEEIVAVSQINDEFSLISLFFRADIVVKLVILILFAASIYSWTIIIHKIRLFRTLSKKSKEFDELITNISITKNTSSCTYHLSSFKFNICIFGAEIQFAW